MKKKRSLVPSERKERQRMGDYDFSASSRLDQKTIVPCNEVADGDTLR